MTKIKTLAIFAMFMLFATGVAFAKSCPSLPAQATFEDKIIRYENGARGTMGFYPMILSGTAQLERQYGPDNCFFEGYITVTEITDFDGYETTDPAFSTIPLPYTIGFVGSMNLDGKTVRVNRTLGSWQESGILTNYDRSSKMYMDSEFVIEDTDISGKGKTSGTASTP